MKRQVAMLVAGMFTTLAVVSGAVAAAQTGVFASSSTTIQPNSEIIVPEITPTLEQTPYTIVETQTVVITAQPEPATTAEPTGEANQGSGERETVLLARLNQAYSVMKQRDNEYQSRLKEAYEKLKAAGISNAGDSSQNGAPSSGATSQPVSVSPTGAPTNDDHPEQETVEHHDDNSTETPHQEDVKHEGEDH